MSRLLRASLLCAALGVSACTSTAPVRTPAATPDVPVERVILFTSGVGYFEHAGQVSGNAEVTLQFDETALNDVLKSLVVEDAQGRVAGVVYPTQAPVERTLRSFAIDLSGSPDLSQILAQARGAEVRVEARTGSVRGTVLAVGNAPADQPKASAVPTVTISTDRGLVTILLSDIRRIAFTDPALQAEIDGALATLAEARGGQRRPVRVQLQGGTARRVRMGYVVEAPVWKTSYRLILPGAEAPAASTEGTLQGWALVENPTEADWTDVDLTLVSGRPVSFVTDLYTPRYIQRPVVVLQDDAVVRPREYQEGVGYEASEEMPILGSAAEAPPPPPAPARSYQAPLITSDAATYTRDRVAAAGLDPTAGFQSSASTGDFGELFAYRLTDVTLPRRASAMLPIIGAGVVSERLSVYSGGTGRHPMRGVRLTNTTGANLRGGPMTVLDDGYAGDAILPDLPAGTQRLLTFAVDQDVLVDPFRVPNAPGRIETATLRDGVLVIRRQQLTTAGYRIENRGARERTILVETRRDGGAELISPQADESTPDLYRIRATVAAGAVDSLVVRQARTTDEQVALASIRPEALVQLVRADGDIPADVRRALEDAITARRALAQTERDLQQLQQEVREIRNDQERIRGNLQSVENNSSYGRRLLRRLDEQETRLDAIERERAALEERASAQRQALRVTVR